MDELRVTAQFDFVEPDELYDAWLDGETHGEMTGGMATSDPQVGGSFTAWDGYIEGRHLELERPRRIVQSWRTSEFAASDADSRVEITFEANDEGTLLRLHHTSIPAGQGERYQTGWAEHYIEPMLIFFDVD